MSDGVRSKKLPSSATLLKATVVVLGAESSGRFTTNAPPGTTYEVVAAPDSSYYSYEYAKYGGNVTKGTTATGKANTFRFYESRSGDYTIDVYLNRGWDGNPDCSRQVLLN